MLIEHGKTAFSSENGYKTAPKVTDLDCIINDVVKAMKKSLEELTGKFDEQTVLIMDQKSLIEDQKKIIEDLTKQLNGTSGTPVHNSTGATWSDLVKGKSSASTAAVVAIMTKEKREVEDKEKNIIISGLVEGAGPVEDEAEVSKVLEILGVKAKANRVRRIGTKAAGSDEERRQNRARLVVVELIDREARDTALRNGKNLRPSYDGVYVNRDRTQNEMLMEKELLRQRNERNSLLENEDGRLRFSIDAKSSKRWYWGIRWGELRKIDKDTGRTLVPTRSA
jgi:hypothetical protein